MEQESGICGNHGCGNDLEKIVVALKERKTLVQITSRRNQNLGRKCWELSKMEQLASAHQRKT